MISKGKHITVFEHQVIRLNQEIDGIKFDESSLKALQVYYGDHGVPYYSLVHKGVKFNEYVGVIQVGNIQIEVLPKADKSVSDKTEKTKWRDTLIGMLRAVGIFYIHAPSSSSLKLKSNSILDLYFELFLCEVEYLLHNGLIKQYRKKESNITSLKGSLQFGKHITQNLTHQERFYVRHTTYDVEHKFHLIIYKTICLLKKINTNVNLVSRIGSILLHFPEMPHIKVTEETFNKLVFTRKNHAYKKAIDIAKLLLLQYHPHVIKGPNHVLALMFDMNVLWEQFVYVSLRKYKSEDITVTPQSTQFFWQPTNGIRSKIRPDIIINKDKKDCVVMDTKWKNLNGFNPSPDDLRQMFVYHEYYAASKVALIYPSTQSNISKGNFLNPKTGASIDKECSVISIKVMNKIKEWQEKIYNDCITALHL